MADTSSSTKASSGPKTLDDFFSASSSKENASLNIKSELDKEARDKPVKKKTTRYQCDYCRAMTFQTLEEAVQHEQSCGARKPKSNSKNDKHDNDAAEKPKKKRKSKPVPQPIGRPQDVYLQFNDGVEVVSMDLCIDVCDDSPITLTGSFDANYKRAAANFLTGFGRFVW